MNDQMKPIISNAEMVRAILDGRETQTRRVVRLCGGSGGHEAYTHMTPLRTRDNYHDEWRFWYYWGPETPSDYVRCPYGQPGDTLWVRETHYLYGKWVKNGFTETGKQAWKFVVLDRNVMYPDDPPSLVRRYKWREEGWYKRPSIHMHRWAARLFLTVKGVRVERVQHIRDRDIKSEGIRADYDVDLLFHWIKLWDEINAKRGYSWEKNPWVWVIEFEVVQ